MSCVPQEAISYPTDTWVLPCVQMSIEQLGYIPPPPLPMNVTGQMDLTQGMSGPMDNGTAATRGYVVVPSGTPYFSNASQVQRSSTPKQNLALYSLSCVAHDQCKTVCLYLRPCAILCALTVA